MMPNAETLYAVVEATWPPARRVPAGPFLLRDGQGGGKRVSAATARRNDWNDRDIDAAEQAMRDLHQPALFMLRDGETRLDQTLAQRGYQLVDPVNMYCSPAADLARNTPPKVSTFAVWPPMAIGYDLWREGGIGPARWAVMARAQGAKTSILARCDDKPAGIAYVGLNDGIAMLHALEIPARQRRKGNAERIMAAAAIWALENGASHFAVVCTVANDAANKLYTKLGMSLIGGYHYRQK